MDRALRVHYHGHYPDITQIINGDNMYILVRVKDNKIVGSAVKKIDEKSASENGCRVYEIPDNEFSEKMLGSKLESFDKD